MKTKRKRHTLYWPCCLWYFLREVSLVASGVGAPGGQFLSWVLHSPAHWLLLSKYRVTELHDRRHMLQVGILIGCWFWHMLWHSSNSEDDFPQSLQKFSACWGQPFDTLIALKQNMGHFCHCVLSTKMHTWKLLWQDDQRAEFISEQLSHFLLKFVPLTFIMSFVWYVLKYNLCWGSRDWQMLLIKWSVTKTTHTPSCLLILFYLVFFAREVLYHLSHVHRPFALVCFSDRVLWFLPRASLGAQSSYLHFPVAGITQLLFWDSDSLTFLPKLTYNPAVSTSWVAETVGTSHMLELFS
jgi:hypothetical protein